MTNFQQVNYSRLSPCVTVADVTKAIDFYTKAFGFEILEKHEREGVVSGASLKLGEVTFMVFDHAMSSYTKTLSAADTRASSGSSIYAYCPDVDALYANAIACGAKSLAAPQDAFWGDRFCQLLDLDGYEWGFATHQSSH